MKLFKKTTKAKEKWRTSARMIDLHKTKVIFLRDTKRQPRNEHLPQWVYDKLQINPSFPQDNSNTLQESRLKAQRLCLNQGATRLRQ